MAGDAHIDEHADFFLTNLRSLIVGVTPVIEIRDAEEVPGIRFREISKYLDDTGNKHRRWVALDDVPELFPPECWELVLCDDHRATDSTKNGIGNFVDGCTHFGGECGKHGIFVQD